MSGSSTHHQGELDPGIDPNTIRKCRSQLRVWAVFLHDLFPSWRTKVCKIEHDIEMEIFPFGERKCRFWTFRKISTCGSFLSKVWISKCSFSANFSNHVISSNFSKFLLWGRLSRTWLCDILTICILICQPVYKLIAESKDSISPWIQGFTAPTVTVNPGQPFTCIFQSTCMGGRDPPACN